MTRLGRMAPRRGWLKATSDLIRLIALFVGFAILVGVIGALTIWWLVLREAFQDRDAMLRVLKTSAEVRAPEETTWTELGDLSPLNPGDGIRVGPEGLAVVQLFDGSAIKMEAGSEIVLSRSQDKGVRGDDWHTFVNIELVRGRIVIKAAKKVSPASSFVVSSGGSAGAVEGTVFEVEVLPDGETRWHVSEGMVRIAALTATEEGKVLAGVIRADPGTYVTVPTFPLKLIQEPVRRSLLEAVAQLAQRSTAEGGIEDAVKGTTLLGSSPDTGNAVFDLSRLTAGVTLPPTVLSPSVSDVAAVVDTALAGFGLHLTLQQAPVVSLPLFPDLPSPQALLPAEAPRPKPAPPSYFFSIYGVDQPMGVAVDPQRDRLYVSEGGGERELKVFTLDGEPVTSLAPPDTNRRTRVPLYVAVGPSGRVYVSDRRRHTIDVWSPEGEYLGRVAPNREWSPLGLTIGSDGNFYVTDVTPGMHRVMVLNEAGTVLHEFGEEGDEPGQFSFPNKVVPAMDGGRLYVADSNNARVQVFNAQGKLEAIVGDSRSEDALAIPRGIVLDEQGRLFVVDVLDHSVHVYQVGSTVESLFSFGQAGVGDGQFNYPNDIASDGRGRFHIADTRNNRVQVWGY